MDLVDVFYTVCERMKIRGDELFKGFKCVEFREFLVFGIYRGELVRIAVYSIEL